MEDTPADDHPTIRENVEPFGVHDLLFESYALLEGAGTIEQFDSLVAKVVDGDATAGAGRHQSGTVDLAGSLAVTRYDARVPAVRADREKERCAQPFGDPDVAVADLGHPGDVGELRDLFGTRRAPQLSDADLLRRQR